MDKIITWFRQHLPTQRRLIQLYTALLYNAHVKGFITGDIFTGASKAVCVPGFNCYSCPGAIAACPLGALQNALASSNHRAPTYVLGILLLFGLTLGRSICGFLCPVGLGQELLFKLPTPKVKKGRITRVLSYVKYVILAVFVVILPLWYSLQSLPLPAFCKYICPAGTLEGAVGLLSNPVHSDKFSMLGLLFTRKTVILIAIVLLCVFVYRGFCRFLCPLGAIYGFFSRVALLGVKVDPPRCIDCGRCISHCRMDVRRVGDHECIHCGECIGVCPTKAISFKAGRITLHAQETPLPRRRKSIRAAAWIAALAMLLAVLIWANQPSAAPEAIPQADESLPVGYAVGERAPDFTLPVFGGGEFTLSEQLGRVTVINFWATWCTPCCSELPYFDRLHREWGDDAAFLAIHTDLVTDDPQAYLSAFDYTMPFALDADGSVCRSLGVSTMLPQTVIVDERGMVVYNQVGSVSYEALSELLAPFNRE